MLEARKKASAFPLRSFYWLRNNQGHRQRLRNLPLPFLASKGFWMPESSKWRRLESGPTKVLEAPPPKHPVDGGFCERTNPAHTQRESSFQVSCVVTDDHSRHMITTEPIISKRTLSPSWTA